MNTVGIMTFHFADNYGAILQCYALNKVINNFSGYHAEIINFLPAQYKYPKRWKDTYTEQKFKNKRFLFDKFLKNECKISQDRFSIVTGNQYDYYCVGSDQVWNTLPMYEEYFFPHTASEAKRISYAASLGIGINDTKLNKDMLKKHLPRFKNISVRETEHVKLIEDLTGSNCERVLDPTLLLEKEEYEKIAVTERNPYGNFIFLYWLNHNNPAPGVELTNALSRRYNLPVIHSIIDAPSYMFANNGGCMFYEGINDFLWYVKNAKFVITNSYHGTIFSILFERPFYTFVVETMRSRIDTLIEIAGIENRVIETPFFINQVVEEIDFNRIKRKIEKEKKQSLQYIKTALDIQT